VVPARSYWLNNKSPYCICLRFQQQLALSAEQYDPAGGQSSSTFVVDLALDAILGKR
jgi:hypothetical protein